MIELDELKRQLDRHSPERLFDDLIVAGSAHYFEDEFTADHAEQYGRFRQVVGAKFGVGPADVMLIGSAKVGYSLHPDKSFRPFDATRSDFDIVIIAPDAFEDLWLCYLRSHYRRERRNFEGQFYGLFRRFLTTGDLLSSDPEYSRWEKRLGPLRREVETEFYFDSRVNFRVYKDIEAVRLYHVDSFSALKNRLSA